MLLGKDGRRLVEVAQGVGPIGTFLSSSRAHTSIVLFHIEIGPA